MSNKLLDKNGSEIKPGDWFVFIRKSHPDKVRGAEHSIRTLLPHQHLSPGYEEPLAIYTNIYFDNISREELTYDRFISSSVLKAYDVLLIPSNIRDLGIKAVVSYLELGGLVVPNEIKQLLNEDQSYER